MIKKMIGSISLICLIICISSAISNWGGDITENTVVVLLGVFINAFIWALCYFTDDL